MSDQFQCPTYWVYDLTISDDKAYVGTRHLGIQVVDISNPMTPEIICSVNTGGRAHAITVSDQTAYVAG